MIIHFCEPKVHFEYILSIEVNQMVMIETFVRPEKADTVLQQLSDQGFSAATRVGVLGRGKQKGLKVQSVYYDELPKELLMIVVQDEDESRVIDIIIKSARTGKDGAFGDGKIFVTPVKTAYTISSAEEGL
jgi:Nitrogen regulatory protein PII